MAHQPATNRHVAADVLEGWIGALLGEQVIYADAGELAF
jgi:hypothetical protein